MSLLGWAEAQSHILTGDGLLNDAFPSFKEEELPHYYKVRGQVDDVFLQWRQERRRSLLVVGAWSRPVFVGGWKESGAWDTEVFNLQTPSLFVDLRFPLALQVFVLVQLLLPSQGEAQVHKEGWCL